MDTEPEVARDANAVDAGKDDQPAAEEPRGEDKTQTAARESAPNEPPPQEPAEPAAAREPDAAPPASDVADVDVPLVSSDNDADTDADQDAPGKTEPVREARANGIESRAAYHSEIDEASVVIVHRKSGD